MVTDKFANRFGVEAAESAAGTAKFFEVPTYVSTFEKVAFVIHRMEYSFLQASLDQLVANGDSLNICLATINTLTTLTPRVCSLEPGVIDYLSVEAHLLGAAAQMHYQEQPIIHDFMDLPGGGLIVPARPLFIGIQGLSLGTGIVCDVRGWFTKVELKGEEYLELVDAYRIIR